MHHSKSGKQKKTPIQSAELRSLPVLKQEQADLSWTHKVVIAAVKTGYEFKVFHKNGELICSSHKGYANTNDCEEAASNLFSAARDRRVWLTYEKAEISNKLIADTLAYIEESGYGKEKADHAKHAEDLFDLQ